MKTFKEVQDFFSRYKPILLEKYKWLSELGIFGSYVRGEQNEESDVDVLVDLSDNLGMKVDVVTKNGLKPRLKERILSEVVYV
jgi:hypothetical protein